MTLPKSITFAVLGSIAAASHAIAANITVTTLAGPGNLGANTYDLTAMGTTDWAFWGTGNFISPTNTMNGGSGLSNFSYTGTVAIDGGGLSGYMPNKVATNGSDPVTFNDDNGIQTNSFTTVDLAAASAVYSLSADASTESSTLYILVNQYRTNARLTITLSDGSATATPITVGNNNTSQSSVFKIDYSAASAGQFLNVSWANDGLNTTDGRLRFEAAALSAIPEPGSYALLVGCIGFLLTQGRRHRV